MVAGVIDFKWVIVSQISLIVVRYVPLRPLKFRAESSDEILPTPRTPIQPVDKAISLSTENTSMSSLYHRTHPLWPLVIMLYDISRYKRVAAETLHNYHEHPEGSLKPGMHR